MDLLLKQVRPSLPGGILVHFHDIFLPGDYRADWAWRNYSEQPAVAGLNASGAYRPEFASAWLFAKRPQLLESGVLARLPLIEGARELSLWLRKA